MSLLALRQGLLSPFRDHSGSSPHGPFRLQTAAVHQMLLLTKSDPCSPQPDKTLLLKSSCD